MRPFRFLATAGDYPGFAELTSLARKAEAVACSAFVLPDCQEGAGGRGEPFRPCSPPCTRSRRRVSDRWRPTASGLECALVNPRRL